MTESDCPTWHLRPLQVTGVSEPTEIPGTGLTLGRDTQNGLVVPGEPYPYVSAHHARIDMLDGTPALTDLGSRNGTIVNGVALHSAEADGPRTLHHGDVIQLGNLGPRYAVLCAANLHDTVPALHLPPQEAGQGSAKRGIGQTEIRRVKRELGIPKGSDVSEMIDRRGSRMLRTTLAAVALVAAGGGIAFWLLRLSDRRDNENFRTSLSTELRDTMAEQMRNTLDRTETTMRKQRDQFVAERRDLEAQRANLAGRIERIESSTGASEGELERLRAELVSTREQLERFNPISLEQTKLREVRRLARAVVFLEVRTYLKHKATGKRLHADRSGSKTLLNLEGRGEEFHSESSGSGFVVGTQGYVLTNAHVVRPDVTKKLPDADLEAETEVDVIFTGESVHRPAKVIRWIYREGADLALVRIEPFQGMPHIAGLELTAPPPEPGTEVYLCGFPLGKLALQQGEVVIASTFKGILSRVVGDFLQVDAAVHPGNSGGPVFNASGKVIGVATRVQRTPDGPYTPTIGYLIPISTFREVWPPPPAAEKGDGTATSKPDPDETSTDTPAKKPK